MKWLAAILMVVNVLIFLGISDRQIESPVGVGDIRPDVNPESMLLLSEVVSESTASRDSATVAGDGNEASVGEAGAANSSSGDGLPTTVLEGGQLARVTIGDDGVVNREAPGGAFLAPQGTGDDGGDSTASAENPEHAKSDTVCYRVGPFRDSGEWQDTVAWVEQQALPWEQVRSASRELRAVRVYIGPYESISAAQPTIELLKEKGLDHFVYLREGSARVSLGYFTQEELATKYVNYLTGQGIDARSQPEYRTLGPFNWMDIRVKRSSIDGLLEKQWAADDVKVSEKRCEVNA